MRDHLERNGMTACVKYEGGIIGQPAIDTTEGDVKRIEMGAGAVPIGIGNALFDMEVGETRVVGLSPMEAFDRQGFVLVKQVPGTYFIHTAI